MDHNEKLEWARDQLESLHREIERFSEDYPYTTRVEVDREAQRIRIFLNPHIPIPDPWRFEVGNIVQNTRSSLDYIMYALSMRAPIPPDEQQVRKIQFPISTAEGHYWGGGKNGKEGERRRRMKFVDPDAQKIIDGLQPYLRRHAPNTHLLAVLDELSNIDKHRNLLVASAVGFLPQVTFQGFGGPVLQRMVIEHGYGPVEPDTQLVGYHFPDGIPEGEVKVDPHLAMSVSFDEVGPGLGQPVVDTLKRTQDFIRDEVFPPLEPFLQ